MASTCLLPHGNDLPIYNNLIRPNSFLGKCQRVVEILHLIQSFFKQLQNRIKGGTRIVSQLLSQKSILRVQEL